MSDTRFVISYVPRERFDDRVEHIADTEAPTEFDRTNGIGLLTEDEERRAKRREQQLCNHGSWFADEELTLTQAANRLGFTATEFTGDAPDGVCSYCWNEACDRAARTRDSEATDRDYDSVGFRLRWKQNGRAREEWYDVIVHPETTLNEVDALVSRRFTTIHDDHLRLYGYEDEYMDSTLDVLPDHQYEHVGQSRATSQRASAVTIADVASDARLQEGDRLSMVCDFGTPSKYYCIVKEVLDEDALEDQMAQGEFLYTTDTAGIPKQRRPDTGVMTPSEPGGDDEADTGDTASEDDDDEPDGIREELERDFANL